MGRGRHDILKTMMSRTSTMNPRTPPPVPYCHELLAVVTSLATGAASAKEARESWRRMLMKCWNMLGD